MTDILRATKKPTRKTRLMYKCNLSYRQAKIYLRLLAETGLLDSHFDENINNQTFVITSKGSKFLTEYSKLKSLID